LDLSLRLRLKNHKTRNVNFDHANEDCGKIVHVTKGLVVDVKGTILYPVEFEFKDVLCPGYFLVAKKGLIDHLHMTPYFFRSEDKRDEFFDFINEHL